MSLRWLAVLAVIGLGSGAGARTAAADDPVSDSVALADPYPSVDDGGNDPVPRAVDGYRNGRRLPIKIITVDWVELEVKTARALASMRAAALADGVALRVRSGFRSHEHQTWLYEAWRAGWGHRAARPGYSNHESGVALDVDLGQEGTHGWLRINGARFGFRATVRNEPWHWEYSRRYVKKVRHRTTSARRPPPRGSDGVDPR